jgi:hypothetical protein
VDATSFSGREATAAGWGWLHETSALGGRADVLQKVTLLVVDNETCKDWYKSKGKKTKILDSQMCAGYEQGGRDSCWVRNAANCRIQLLALLILVITEVKLRLIQQLTGLLTLGLLMLHICGVSKTFGEWYQKTNNPRTCDSCYAIDY